jgi:hypothetical protein
MTILTTDLDDLDLFYNLKKTERLERGIVKSIFLQPKMSEKSPLWIGTTKRSFWSWWDRTKAIDRNNDQRRLMAPIKVTIRPTEKMERWNAE